jgi:hypothetical protein
VKRRRALLKYDDAPPSASGLEVSVYLADEVDEVLKRQASAALAGMNAAKAISSHDLERAARLRAESSPDALESERQANAKLTQELSLAEEGLANYARENAQLKASNETLALQRDHWLAVAREKDAQVERLREAIETHRQAIGNGGNMVEADEELWAILQPEPQPGEQT